MAWRGRVRDGWLDERAAYVALAAVMEARERGPAARIMRAFSARPLFEITPAEVGRYLASLDADPTIGPRTVNTHRQVLCTPAQALAPRAGNAFSWQWERAETPQEHPRCA